ncbi:MAG: peptidase domain-containing ABC transporter [Xenococcaceae cyanobacterium]
MVVSKQNLDELLVRVLGTNFSEQELVNCSQQIEILEPSAGQLFWRSLEANPGIFLILAGKVRLLDESENLIASLDRGQAFGELTIFPNESFYPYAIRASVNLQLGYLEGNFLETLSDRHPQIREHLYNRAKLKDLLVIHFQAASQQNISRQNLLNLLPLLEEYDITLGRLPETLLQGQQLWLLRQGELQHSSGQKLAPGNIYNFSELPHDGTWRVTQPTQLYSLRSDRKGILETENATVTSAVEVVAIEPTQRQPLRSTRKQTTKTSSSKKEQNNVYFPSPNLKFGQFWQQITGSYPFYEQHSSNDCGIACLVMLGRYWGKNFSINELRSLANVNRDGSTLQGLINAAESVGFSTRPVQATLDGLSKHKAPAIVHWEGKHYIVVYKVTRDRVIVSDPAIGRRVLSHREFLAHWKGYTLLIQPTALLKETPEAKGNLWAFFELIKPHWFLLLEIFLASLAIQLFGLVTPVFTQLLLDRVVVQRSTVTLTAIGLGLLIFSLFQVIMTSLRRYLIFHTANRVDLSMIVGFVNHTLRLPLSYFESRFVGDITSRIDENRKIRRFLTGSALILVLDLMTVFIYVGFMFWYSWQLALLSVTIFPFFLFLALFATPFLQRVSREIFKAKTKEESYLIEVLTGINTIKSMGLERSVRWHWEELFNKSVKVNLEGQIIGERLNLAASLVEMIFGRALLLYGAWQVIQGQLSIGQLIAFNMLLGNVISPLIRLADLWNEFQEIVIALERINDVIDTEPEENQQILARPSLPTIRGRISFEKVSFRYASEGDRNVLENISFEIQPGQTVALVGRSGSGKTTISKLILGLYAPTEGKIFVDGRDITGISLRSLRQQIGVVDQDTFLFGGTIRENLTVGHPDATDEEVEEAARLAGANLFIDTMPLKYDTHIGEGGGRLSGGQRQRLAIARALLGNPRLLVLDEATSNLDAESERIIQNNLNTILKSQTTLIIAHRLSTVRKADLILVLDKGILVESGTHEELMAKRGQYYYLNQQQLSIA